MSDLRGHTLMSESTRRGIPDLYLGLLTLLLSLCWLLPNHYRPWTAFQSDAWCSLILIIAAFWITLRSAGPIELPGLALLFAGVATIPWWQHLGGIIYSSGNAWIQSLYLAGFSATIAVGYHWQRSKPWQAFDFLFSALLLAGLASVALEALQVANQTGIWVLETPTPGRASGNIGQPNQLATLLVLALLGVAWWYRKEAFGAGPAALLTIVLLTGLALTLSRTGWLNLLMLCAGLGKYWQKRRPKHLLGILLAMSGYFIAITLLPPSLMATTGEAPSAARNLSDPARLAIWRSSLQAISLRPWLGWGWDQVNVALMATSFTPPTGLSISKHCHNILLDLLMYNGVPLALAIIAPVVLSMARTSRGLLTQDKIVPALAIAAILVHAMLELPLHYAYFLLPLGLMVGAATAATRDRTAFATPKALNLTAIGVLALGLWLTSVDYLKAEKTFYQAGDPILAPSIGPTLPMYVLKQWEERLAFTRSPAIPFTSPQELRHAESVVFTTPQASMEMKLAQRLALSERPGEAKKWLQTICHTGNPGITEKLQARWLTLGQTEPRLKAIEWQCPRP